MTFRVTKTAPSGLAIVIATTLSLATFMTFTPLAAAAQSSSEGPEIFPLEDIRPGMVAQVLTIFEGTEIEEFELEVIGVLRSFVGPGQDMILVRLLGEKPNYTGVVAGMSGSPVYIDGKLVGALAYRLGTLTREAIGGVTPFQNMIRASEAVSTTSISDRSIRATHSAQATSRYPVSTADASLFGLPGTGTRYLVPIETPISYVGVHSETLRRFSSELGMLGLVSAQGGGEALPENLSALEAGGAVSAALITGDLKIAATCTITARIGDTIYACGHPILGYGDVALPMARAEIVTTVASELNSFKIASIGDLVGTFTHDRKTAIVGTIGAVPPMIPVDLTIHHGGREFKYNYEIFQHPKFSSTLMSFTLFNGLNGTIESGEGFTYDVKGRIRIAGHDDIVLDDMFGPTGGLFPDAFFVANDAARAFQEIYSNPFETPEVEGITLEVELLPERRTSTLENAWLDKSEVAPGETVTIRTVLQPYRGVRLVKEITVKIPEQAARGPLSILVSDASTLDRITRTLTGGGRGAFSRFQPGPRISGLAQLITILNRQRRNDRLYVALFQRAPTVLVEDKVLPSVPLSQLNVLTRQQVQGSTTVFFNSMLDEQFEPLHQVVSGSRWLQVTVR